VRLSPHFSLAELTTTAHRTIDNTAPRSIIDRLRALCLALLEPVRDQFGPLRVTSGYRCPELNTAIGGAKASAHVFGCAVDFAPWGGFAPGRRSIEIVQWIVDSDLPYDQVIDEYSSTSSWAHLGALRPGVTEQKPRRMALTMRRGVYSRFDGL